MTNNEHLTEAIENRSEAARRFEAYPKWNEAKRDAQADWEFWDSKVAFYSVTAPVVLP